MSLGMATRDESYRLVSPDGHYLSVTKEVYDSLYELFRRKAYGSVTITFRNGGIMGVESAIRTIYK